MWYSSKRRDKFQRKMDSLILVAKATRDAGEFVPFPFVKAAAATVLTLLESIRGMKVNEDDSALLAQDAINLLQQIAMTAKEAPLESTRLQKPVEDFVTILNNTLKSVLEIAERSSIKRYLHQASDADALKEHRQEIASAFTLFMTVTQIQIRQEQERAREEQQRALEEQRKGQEERRRIKEERQRDQEQQEKERKRAAESRLLASLPVVQARWNEEKTCLKGTRVTLLDEIRSWAQNQDSTVKPIYWLADVAGSGKSTIANHMANEWRTTGKLGGCFSFSRDVSERTVTKHFVATLCGDLAEWHPELKSVICEAIEANPLFMSRPLRDQFKVLIAHPLTQTPKDVIFVIDALDECVIKDRRALLNLLITELSNMSHPIKFFITSRPEWDISEVLRESSQNRGGFDLHGSQNRLDLRLYVESQLLCLKSTGHSTLWPGPSTQDVTALAERAGGLFIWASTACRMIKDSIDPRNLLSRLLKDTSLTALNKLYMEALDLATLPSDPIEREDVARILETIVMVMEPLSIDSIDDLLGVTITERVVQRLASVLSVSHDRTQPVRTLHPTFREFLIDHRRCTDSSFLVDIKATHRRLSEACFRSLRNLRKDICNINDASLLNTEIPDLENMLAQFLPSSQGYACRFWASHTAEVEDDEIVRDSILKFFKTHFLHWLEALSLMGRTDEAAWALHRLRTEMKPDLKHHEELRLWYHDVLKFVQLHQILIKTSASHIYMSALIFTPQSTMIAKHYKPPPNFVPIVLRNQDMSWPLGLTLVGHSDWVWTVSFSPDGHRVASGADDGTIRLWDAISGLPVGTPLEGHTGFVRSVAFSPDGTRIVSGSHDNTLRLWDAVSGFPVGTPLNRHTAPVQCIAFSRDGSRIASCSEDKTICLWDAVSGLPIGTPLEGHTGAVWSVAFSPDGTRIASGSEDRTIRLWDAISGSPAGTPLTGHSDAVSSLSFSPNGFRIASGSWDKTLQLWDVASSPSPVGTPLVGHTDWIRCVTFSPDGTRIVSCSDDKTVRIWDAASGLPLGTPLDHHYNFVLSISFSPDGAQIASSSKDKTIRLFDHAFGLPLDVSLDGHAGSVNCVAFSPDGTRIASGSSDKTVRMWDAFSVSPVRTPFSGHTDGVTCITFSLDGTRIASGSQDNTVHVWDPVTGSPLGSPFNTHIPSNAAQGVDWLRFSPNNQSIEASFHHGGVRYWQLDDAQLPLCKTAPHNQATVTEATKEVELEEDGWVYRTGGNRQRLLYIPHALRRCSDVRGARVVTGSDQGQIAIIDCSNLLA